MEIFNSPLLYHGVRYISFPFKKEIIYETLYSSGDRPSRLVFVGVQYGLVFSIPVFSRKEFLD